MLIIEDKNILKETIQEIVAKKNKKIALIPTMGNIHDGHLSLIKAGMNHANIIIVSIFVNPMQFNEEKDFITYPRTLNQDYEILKKNNVNIVYVPHFKDIYPNGINEHTFINVQSLSNILEGKSRPNHFYGVATIIAKLFNIIQPNLACFGEKDYQQLLLIRKMTLDLNYPIKIISVPIVRDINGLALSSRNKLLDEKEKKIANKINKILNNCAKKIENKINTIQKIIESTKKELIKNKIKLDTIFIRNAQNLNELNEKTKYAIILLSVRIGKIRLIDNKKIKLF
ncbi:MAG: pantoate--beta-alanine ligase [Arsenophonus sp.]|nr:MAG: pantoate--beta-alanine ligase [Arsenophonus sp.]